MNVLFLTNLPSPYRVDFFNALGEKCRLTVLYERRAASDRDEKWKSDQMRNYREIHLHTFSLGADKSIGFDFNRFIKTIPFDVLCISGYSSPTAMLAIASCKRRGIPYYLEVDGILPGEESAWKKRLKTGLIAGAAGYFSPNDLSDRVLMEHGAEKERIFRYPFTCLKEEDLTRQAQLHVDKSRLKHQLGIPENKMVLSVGRFIPGKGFDTLLHAACNLDNDIAICLVGGEPTKEFLDIQQREHLNNVYFVGFQTKEELEPYYQAADLFILPTRNDIWGLVINEAMAHALPVITTDRCGAGLTLIREGENGYIVPADDEEVLADRIRRLIDDDELRKSMGMNAFDTIRPYTIEKMVLNHFKIFNDKL